MNDLEKAWLRRMYDLPREKLGEIYVDSNRYKFHPLIADGKPGGFDQLKQFEQYANPEFRALCSVLRMVLSEWEQSWMWWKIELGKTSTEHAEWWEKSRRVN